MMISFYLEHLYLGSAVVAAGSLHAQVALLRFYNVRVLWNLNSAIDCFKTRIWLSRSFKDCFDVILPVTLHLEIANHVTTPDTCKNRVYKIYKCKVKWSKYNRVDEWFPIHLKYCFFIALIFWPKKTIRELWEEVQINKKNIILSRYRTIPNYLIGWKKTTAHNMNNPQIQGYFQISLPLYHP